MQYHDGRIARLKIPGDLVLMIGASPGKLLEVVSNDVPADSRVISIEYEMYSGYFVFNLSSPSLPMIPYGATIPFLDGPTFKVVDRE